MVVIILHNPVPCALVRSKKTSGAADCTLSPVSHFDSLECEPGLHCAIVSDSAERFPGAAELLQLNGSSAAPSPAPPRDVHHFLVAWHVQTARPHSEDPLEFETVGDLTYF